MIDHAATYRTRKLRHWHHRARLRQLVREVSCFRDASSVADVGCSNGYVTTVLDGICRGRVTGFDYLPSLIEEARARHPHMAFRLADLNRKIRWRRQYDLVCCFETLEHVGDLRAALDNLAAAVRTGGVLLASVPVETGFWGIAKFCAKSCLGYRLDEIAATRHEYLWTLLRGRDITRFREPRYAWGTHYGFDWRKVERGIAARMAISKAYTRYASRIIVARKPA